jgi:tRNA pseudouridine38-40 synthase
VQGDVEDALAKVFGDEVTSAGAGRTDAGVHALGQVMGVAEAPDDLDVIKIRDALNGMCAPSICIWECSAMASDWHARHSARSRTYIYALLEGDVPDPWLAGTSLYHPEALDMDGMNEAAGHLVGPHDFASFGRPPQPGGSTERNLYELRCARSGRIVTIRARANAFIQQMVRSLVGTLIQVGEGRRSPDEMLEVLAARDRAAAGPVAAPHGLCLVSVEYDAGWSRPAPA